MRSDYFAPRLQPALPLPFSWSNGDFAALAAYLFVEPDSEQFLFAALDLGRLLGRDCTQQPMDTVERAIGVVGGKWLLMSPIVACVAQFLNQVAFGLAE